jgi:adenine-specific DNA-methyltransferase
MPILHWLNDDEARKTSSRVPYRLLEADANLSYQSPSPALGRGARGEGNMLIQGDNLEALKALLPYYAGQVKCIYIDPPYNTRSAFEHYDDNLEHSIWLSTMYPRMEMLRDLLANDGSIWVSIDDNEGHYLKVMMDEVFGRNNFIATVVWQSRYSRSNDASLSISHNFIHVYARDPDLWKVNRNRLQRTEKQAAQYSNPDNDERGPWRAIPWDAPNLRPNLTYPIKTPTGKLRMPPSGRCWSRTEDQWLQIVNDGLAYFGKSGDGAPSIKQFLKDASAIVPNTWWGHEEVGHTDEAKKEGQLLFNEAEIFATPKPERLIQRVIHIATNPNDLVLDSFLGSGTTAAVAHKMGRRYIGIEMGDHAVTHCVPRLKKVVDGEQGGISQEVNWQGGGGFHFYKLGEAIFNEEGQINPAVKFRALAAHVWFTETHTPLPHVVASREPQTASGEATSPRKGIASAENHRLAMTSPLLGVHNGAAYYLLYNGILGDTTKDGGNVLTGKVLASLPPHQGPKVIYGELTTFGSQRLTRENIIFKQVPYDIKAR